MSEIRLDRPMNADARGAAVPCKGRWTRAGYGNVRHHMSVTLRRVIALCLASAIVPTIFLIGGLVLGIDALLNWPSWLLFVWPTSLMFNALAGVTPP